MRTNSTRQCLICNATFTPKASNVRKGGGKYCSPSCYAESRRRLGDKQFWDKVVKTDGCWTWVGAKHDREGYGYVARRKPGGGKVQILAHRMAYVLIHGDIPDDMCVCHTCDNPSCVRPDHLFLGSQEENIADMVKKGRARNHWTPKRSSGDPQSR